MLRKNLYKVRPNGSGLTRLAEDVVSVASWSPDGQRLAVAKNKGDNVELFILTADGSDQFLVTTITSRKAFEQTYTGPYLFLIRTVSWSPDETHILYSCDLGMCVVNVETKRVVSLVQKQREIHHVPYVAAWSPEGTRIAVFTPGVPEFPDLIEYATPPMLYTVARDGTDRRDLIRLDEDGNLAPANQISITLSPLRSLGCATPHDDLKCVIEELGKGSQQDIAN